MAEIKSIQIGSTTYDLRDDTKVVKNTAITAGTKCKITYDAKGLVTTGANLTATDIPNLSADKINSGTLGADRIPSLAASKITSGTFDAARIPNLAASKITSGTFDTARIPSLDADKINSGTLGIARIPTGDNTSTSADYVVKCNDSRLSDSRPASDVSAWAKASTKPSYNFGEIGAGVATIGDGANRLMFRTNSGYVNGVYYSTPGNEALIFATKNPVTSWMFATVTDPTAGTSWQNLTPALQIKKQSVAINKLIGNNVDPTYNLDVNGTLNAATIYQNGTALATVATSGSYGDLSNRPTIPATNVIPATTTANKLLLSTTTSGTAAWSSWSSAGFLKTNSSGVVSVDASRYVRYDTASQGLTTTQKSNARTNIGAQAALPTTSTAGKVLKSTSTAGTVEWGDAGGGSLYLHKFILSGYFDPGCGEYDFELHGHYVSSSTAAKYTESDTDLLKLMSEGEIDYGIWQDDTWSVVKWPSGYSSKRGEITSWGFMWVGNDYSYDPPHYFMYTSNSGDFGMYDTYTTY